MELDTATLFDPALILTAAGATVGAGLVSTIVEVLKHIAGIGPIVQRSPATWAVVLDGLLVAGSYASITNIGGGVEPVSLPGVIAAVIAWGGMAAISTKAYEVVAARRSGGS
jgi:hypothetical protein